MISKLTNYVEFKEIPIPPELLRCDVSAEDIRQEESAVLRRHMVLVPAETVTAGSLVSIAVSSKLPKFNRSQVTFVVGQGHYSQALEERLIGLSAGAAFDWETEGTAVSGRVLSVREKRIPRSMDEITLEKDLDGADNYADWLSSVREKIRTNLQIKAFGRIEELLLDELKRHTGLRIDRDELKWLEERECRLGLEYTASCECAAKESFSDEKKGEILAIARENAKKKLCTAVYGQAMCARQGTACPEGKNEVEYYSRVYQHELMQYIRGLLDIRS